LPGNKNHTYENIGYTSSHQAELVRSQKQSDFINGKFNIPSQNAEVISLQRLVDEYYSTRTDLYPTTLKKYKSHTNRFIDFISENFPQAYNDISVLKFNYVIEFLDRARKREYYPKPWSDKNCNGARAVFQMIFDYAVKRKYVDENPIRDINPFTIPEKTTGQAISNSDLRIIFKKLPKHWVDAFKFLLNTGLRNSELTNLTWNNFHHSRKGNKTTYYIAITSSDEFTTKTRKSRQVPLNREALAIIKRRKGFNAKYIFTTSFKEKISKHRLTKVLNKVQEKEDFHYRVHDFRHTFGSKLATRNVSLYKISILMGHTIQETTKLYAHLQSEDLLDAVNLIRY
jgi:integrase